MRSCWIHLLALALAVATAGGCGRDSAAAANAANAATRPAQAVAKAAQKPASPLPAGSSCVTAACHATYKTAAHIHGPVSEGACSACHQDDIGGHSYPLKRNLTATCTFCHAVTGNKLHQHKAIAEKGCVACHDPHTSTAKYLLTADNVEGVCVKCHDVPLKKHAHEPFAAGQCTLCHLPHESDTVALLRGGNGPEHCFTCHSEIRSKINKAAYVHKPVTEACTTCHGPHATDEKHQLKKPLNDTCLSCHPKIQEQLAKAPVAHGAMQMGDGCANCHDPHASNQPRELKDRMDRVCMSCHDKDMKGTDGRVIASMKETMASKNLHGPVRSGNCSDCHNPHGAAQPNLLRQVFPKSFYASFDLQNYALCFGCHDKQLVLTAQTANLTNFRDGDRNLHFVHVNRDDKGRTCKACHAVHGSDLPKHMAETVPFEGSAWAMPMNFEQTPDGGRCAPGCHEPLAYSRGKPLNTTPRATTRGKP